MTTPLITGGSVTYGRNVKIADFENKKLDVTLNFGVPEGDEITAGALEGVIDQAIILCHTKLGIAGGVLPNRVKAEVKVETAAPDAKAEVPVAKPRAAKRPPPVEVKLTDDEKAEARGAISTTPEDRKDPADAEAIAAVESTDVGVDDPFTAAPAEITNAQLVDAATKWVAKNKAPLAARQLVAKYVNAPKGLTDIDPALRAEFLEKLENLKVSTTGQAIL